MLTEVPSLSRRYLCGQVNWLLVQPQRNFQSHLGVKGELPASQLKTTVASFLLTSSCAWNLSVVLFIGVVLTSVTLKAKSRRFIEDNSDNSTFWCLRWGQYFRKRLLNICQVFLVVLQFLKIIMKTTAIWSSRRLYKRVFLIWSISHKYAKQVYVIL